MNTVYRRQNLGDWLRHFRLNSYNSAIRSQTDLANELFTEQKRISKIEQGEVEPRLELAARWCEVTGWHEGWDIISHMYQLDPFSVPPIHPELSRRLGDAIINMRRQIRQAEKALDDLEEANNSRRPTRPFEINNILKKDACELFDLIPATKTIMYAAERDIDLNIEEISREWTLSCLSDDLLVPTFDRLKRTLAEAK